MHKISYKLHIITFGIALTIFIIGVLVGTALTGERAQYLQDVAYQQTLDYTSLQLQSLYLDVSADNASCTTFSHILEQSLSKVADAQAKVDFYIKESSDDADYSQIKRDYALNQIRYWLLNKRIQSACKSEHAAILYFYSNDECPGCGPQATILNYLKEEMGDKLLVFSLDIDFNQEPMIDIMQQSYNITTVPSIVINDKVFEGVVETEGILEIICAKYSNPPQICNQVE